MTIPVPARSGGACPIDRVERGKTTRRRGRSRPATLHVAQDYRAVGLPVFPLWPGGTRQRNQCGKHEAATDADRIRVWRRRWLTASIGLRPLRVVCLTRRGQAT